MKLVLIQTTVVFVLLDDDPSDPSEETTATSDDRKHELHAHAREALRPFFPEQFALN